MPDEKDHNDGTGHVSSAQVTESGGSVTKNTPCLPISVRKIFPSVPVPAYAYQFSDRAKGGLIECSLDVNDHYIKKAKDEKHGRVLNGHGDRDGGN